jgi:branched-subunit amino acid transport protein
MAAPGLTVWLTIAAAGLLTFLTRLSFIALLGRWQLPELLRRGLRYVPPAVLCAIIFPEVLMRNGNMALGWDNPRLLAGIIAALVGWYTRNIFLTIAVGMVSFYLIQALVR